MPRVRILALFTAFALVFTACGSDEKTPEGDDTESQSDSETETTEPSGPLAECAEGLDEITVTGDHGTKPTLDFDTPFSAESSACTVLIEGTGAGAVDGDTILFNYVFVNAQDGTELGSSYGVEQQVAILSDRVLRGIRMGLVGQKAGSRVLVAITPGDRVGLQLGGATSSPGADDTLLFVVDIDEIRETKTRAEGTAVDPVDGLPTVVLAEDGTPTITVPEGDPPAELVIQPLIEGTGPVVTSGQTITVNYVGALYKDGTEFDSSWERGAPTEFPIGTGGVIPGWDKGLVGQKVGSQILLVIPPVDGYGTAGAPSAGIGGTDTLVFVIDILEARGA